MPRLWLLLAGLELCFADWTVASGWLGIIPMRDMPQSYAIINYVLGLP